MNKIVVLKKNYPNYQTLSAHAYDHNPNPTHNHEL